MITALRQPTEPRDNAETSDQIRRQQKNSDLIALGRLQASYQSDQANPFLDSICRCGQGPRIRQPGKDAEVLIAIRMWAAAVEAITGSLARRKVAIAL